SRPRWTSSTRTRTSPTPAGPALISTRDGDHSAAIERLLDFRGAPPFPSCSPPALNWPACLPSPVRTRAVGPAPDRSTLVLPRGGPHRGELRPNPRGSASQTEAAIGVAAPPDGSAARLFRSPDERHRGIAAALERGDMSRHPEKPGPKANGKPN